MNDPEFTGESLWARVDVPKKAWGDLEKHERAHWNDIAKRCNFGRILAGLTQDEFEKRLGVAKNELAVTSTQLNAQRAHLRLSKQKRMRSIVVPRRL